MARLRVHLICNAHLDPVWQWRWEEGASEAIATFRNAAILLREHKGFIFNHNEAVLYRWVEKYDPALFREIRALVREGRGSIAGGWYLQPDVNMPGLESIIRQITEGRRYFREKFRARPRVACNFDSFGHGGGLPQILRLAGYRMYIYMRPERDELGLPAELYRWRGVDGSEILTLRIETGLYHSERDNLEEKLREGVDLALQLGRGVAVFWGLGNHGGGATREALAANDAFMAREKRTEIIHSTPDRLYEALKVVGRKAPVVEGDLQRVFTGCYTSLSRVKRKAEESLAALVQAETLCAASWWLTGAEFPEEDLGEAWRDHLVNDFHDILTGSCSRPFWKGEWHLRVFGRDGREVLSQEEQPESLLPFSWRKKVCFLAELPGVGAARFEVKAFRGKRGGRIAPPENPELTYNIDRNRGLIASLRTRNKTQLLSGLVLDPLVVKDEGDSWGTGCWAYRDGVGPVRS